jgi:hypothetical protein
MWTEDRLRFQEDSWATGRKEVREYHLPSEIAAVKMALSR